MTLAGFSFFFLFVGFIGGLSAPKSKFWDWVDTAYYPLAVLGVLLLYFENAPLRTIASIEDNQADSVSELRVIEELRPRTDMQISEPSLIRNGGEWLKLISKMDTSCDGAARTLPACYVVEDLAPITIPAERLLLGYEGPDDVGKICDAAGSIFARLQNSRSLTTFLMRPLAEYFFQGVEKGFHSNEFESVQTYINNLQHSLEKEVQKMLSDLSLNEDDEARMAPIYAAEIRYGLIVMRAFEVCMRAPEEVRSGKYSAWLDRSQNKQSEIELQEEELRRLRQSAHAIGPATELRISYWPFIIVLALALKFAKGVAHIRKTHSA